LRASGPLRLLAATLALALAVHFNILMDRRARFVAPRHSFYLPSGKYLGHASLGFRNLLADLLYVWSIQYYSEERADRWHYLARLYDIITDLDPKFGTAYTVGALILSLEAGRTEASLTLLDKAITNLPDSYEMPFDAGFYARSIGDMEAAQEYFRIAKERPGAPSFVHRWYAFIARRGGDKLAALELWQQLAREATTDYESQIAERSIKAILMDIQLAAIRSKIEQFEAAAGRCPSSLDEMVEIGALGSYPYDPEGVPYVYDSATCQVRTGSSFLQRHRIRE